MSILRRARARWCMALALAAAPLPALATDTLDLPGGFQPDPELVTYQSAGETAAAEQVRGCPGFAGAEPALTANLTDATVPLHVYLVGEGAVGVLVAGPDGISRCETKDAFGIAHVRVGRPLSGPYLVWPLAAEAGATAEGTILISEADLTPRDVVNFTGIHVDPSLLPPLLSEVPLQPGAEPAFGRLSLPEAGTADLSFALTGGVPASEAGSGCTGEIIQTRPDATLTLTTPEPLLVISATAEPDTALLVVAPDGEIYCNDDFQSRDPVIGFQDAAPGDYAIWVAVYPGGAGAETHLSAGREPPAGLETSSPSSGGGVALNREAEPALGRLSLLPEGPLEVPMVLAGGAMAGEAVEGCSGEIDPSRPDAVLTLEADEPSLWISASANGIDTTLVVIDPNGSSHCNDDYQSADPAVQIEGAVAGDYAVWVGTFGGGSGASAMLRLAREAPEGGMAGGMSGGMAGGGTEGSDENPFAGHPVSSAAEALAVLVEAEQLGEALTYERLEETGPEGLVLHGVVLTDPSGTDKPMRIGRIRVSDLDLAGLSASGIPDRFSIAFEDIDYSSLATEGQAMDLPVPMLQNPPPLSLSASLLPPGGDMTRRDLEIGLSLDGQLALSLSGRMIWPQGVVGIGPEMSANIQAESLGVDLHDMGFLGAVLRETAAKSGQSVEEAVAQGLQELEAMLEPLTPGSPRQKLVAALRAKLEDLDQHGVVRLRLTAATPSDFMSLFGSVAGDEVDPALLVVDITYQPDP